MESSQTPSPSINLYELLTEDSGVFTAIGVFGAVSIYLSQFGSRFISQGDFAIRLGVASSLFLFVLASFSVLQRLVRPTFYAIRSIFLFEAKFNNFVIILFSVSLLLLNFSVLLLVSYNYNEVNLLLGLLSLSIGWLSFGWFGKWTINRIFTRREEYPKDPVTVRMVEKPQSMLYPFFLIVAVSLALSINTIIESPGILAETLLFILNFILHNQHLAIVFSFSIGFSVPFLLFLLFVFPDYMKYEIPISDEIGGQLLYILALLSVVLVGYRGVSKLTSIQKWVFIIIMVLFLAIGLYLIKAGRSDSLTILLFSSLSLSMIIGFLDRGIDALIAVISGFVAILSVMAVLILLFGYAIRWIERWDQENE